MTIPSQFAPMLTKFTKTESTTLNTQGIGAQAKQKLDRRGPDQDGQVARRRLGDLRSPGRLGEERLPEDRPKRPQQGRDRHD